MDSDKNRSSLTDNIRNSIRGKYAVTIIIGIILTALIISIGASVIIHIRAVSNASSVMDLHCRREGDSINESLSSVEQSVKFMQVFAQNADADIDRLMDDESARRAYSNLILIQFQGLASETDGCMSYFFRYNPEDFSGEEGFLYSMEYESVTLSEGFKKMQLIPLRTTDENDDNYAWFFEPLITGSGAWIPARYDDSLRMKVITYAEPVYFQGKVIGVLGMNIDFNNLLEKIGKNRLYETGSVFLMGADGTVLGMSGPAEEEETALFEDRLIKFSSNGETISYHYRGKDKRLVYCMLRNSMRLVITAQSQEIFREEREMLIIGLLMAALVSLILAAFGIRQAGRVTRPIRNLADATSQLDGKNFMIDIPGKERTDEIGGLARAMQETMDKAREYSDYIEGLAYKDALTGLNNKAAYDMRMQGLNASIAEGGAEFAIVMVDLNFLKRINDKYGHGMGNQYICSLCEKIIEHFPADDVYRVGGDEFIIVLTGRTYEEREKRVAGLRNSIMFDSHGEGEPWERVSAAVGMAAYDRKRDLNARSVFDRADADMYERKQAMKAERE